MSLTKQSFGLLITTMTHWWGPTTIRISGDASVADQIRKTEDGLVEFSFPERMIMIANHQIYTDWLYLWWVGYANTPKRHGSLFIILKESLKYIPIVGPGMMFYGFIFMSRKMAIDQHRMAYRLRKLKTTHTAPDGKSYLDPMWLLLFPEGTNASQNGRNKSAKWAAKIGVKDPEHMLLPRSTGIYFCLNELKGTVDYVYDCTVAYEGVPRGKFGEKIFTLGGTYIKGQTPKSVNFYWRRFRVADIPLENQEEFEVWLRERWYEKDALMEQYVSTGRFPPNPADAVTKGQEPFLETEVRTRYPWEFLQIYSVLGAFGLVVNVILKIWNRFLSVIS
ncbi:acyltransferase-domain-containing protein [Corynascus similis CBS 632.67]